MRQKVILKFIVAVAAFVVASSAVALSADSVKSAERKVEKLAEGVYMIRHRDAPDTFPQSNTTVIIGEREALVVDSCYLPSSAREDIAQIRQWTTKPVRYLVNTHWHFDHTMGNAAYWEAFPALSIVAHLETAQQSAGYNPGWFERFPQRAVLLKQILETGKDNNGKVLSEAEKKEYREAIAGLEPVQAEFKSIAQDRHPNLTFSEELSVDLGSRRVQIKHLGRGNTAGDAIVYLPEEKILIAGDLLVAPVPYLFGGYPTDFVTTLQRMAAIDAQTIVPGHGDALRGESGKAYIKLVTDFQQAVVAQVSRETFRLGSGARNLEAVREAVKNKPEIIAWRQKFAGSDKDNQDFFDTTLAALITTAHSELSRR